MIIKPFIVPAYNSAILLSSCLSNKTFQKQVYLTKAWDICVVITIHNTSFRQGHCSSHCI